MKKDNQKFEELKSAMANLFCLLSGLADAIMFCDLFEEDSQRIITICEATSNRWFWRRISREQMVEWLRPFKFLRRRLKALEHDLTVGTIASAFHCAFNREIEIIENNASSMQGDLDLGEDPIAAFWEELHGNPNSKPS